MFLISEVKTAGLWGLQYCLLIKFLSGKELFYHVWAAHMTAVDVFACLVYFHVFDDIKKIYFDILHL